MSRSTMPFSSVTTTRHRVREFVCAYRPLRDAEGHVVSLPTLVLNNPETAARALTPLLAQEPVEVFAIACLSARKLSVSIPSRSCCAPKGFKQAPRSRRISTLTRMAKVIAPNVSQNFRPW